MNDITLVTRQFQSGKNIENYDTKGLKNTFWNSLKNLIDKNKYIKEIIIITNLDEVSKHSEISQNDISPSQYYIENLMEEDRSFLEKNKIKLRFIVCKENWGPNAGSATGLNLALNSIDSEYVMFWSKEMQISSMRLNEAFNIMKKYNYDLIGFLREGWENNLPWKVAQNTANIWKTEKLKSIDGFDLSCNGKEEYKITLPNGKEALLAGMEDFHSMVRLCLNDVNFTWTMVGKKDPLLWKFVDTEENRVKIMRQEKVMFIYLEKLIGNDLKTMQLIKDKLLVKDFALFY